MHKLLYDNAFINTNNYKMLEELKNKGETANKVVKKASSYDIVKINRSKDHVINEIKNLKIINEKSLDKYVTSNNFKQIIRKENFILKHPVLIKKIAETNDAITCKMITLTHSPNNININNQIVKKVKVGSYWKEGKEISQYATDASCIIVVKKNDINVTIQNISNNSEGLEKLGDKDNIEKIIQKLDHEWESKPTYDYKDYFKKALKNSYEK